MKRTVPPFLIVALLVLGAALSGCGSAQETEMQKALHKAEEEFEEMTPAQQHRQMAAADAAQRRYERRQKKCPEFDARPGTVEGTPSLHVGCGEIHPWPLTVKQGILECEESEVAGFVQQSVTLLTPDGTVYGINGTALDDGYADFKHTIWKKSPEGHGLMVDVGPLIDRGLALCEGS